MPRTGILITAIVVSILCLVVFSRLPQPSKIESAKHQEDLNRRVSELDPKGGAGIRFALWFDYLFMVAYVTAIGLGCAMMADRTLGIWQTIGRILAYAQIASGLVDALENASLLYLVMRGFDPQAMGIARFATSVKFVAPITGVLYIVIAAIFGRR